MADANDSPPPSPSSRRAKPKQEKGPPRPPNAWILYRSDKLKELELQTPKGKPRRPQAVISKEISAMWKAESKETKTHYEWLSDVRKAEHQAMYPGYRFQPVKKEDKERMKLEAKKLKAKEREESGGVKRTKRRSSSGSAKNTRKSPSPPLHQHLLPPNFSFMTPPDSHGNSMHVFDSSAPIASTSSSSFPSTGVAQGSPISLQTVLNSQPMPDLSDYSLDQLGLDFGGPTFNSEDGSYSRLDQNFLELSFPGGSLPLPSPQSNSEPLPFVWGNDHSALGPIPNDDSFGLLSGQITSGSDGVYFLNGVTQADLDANPGSEIQLTIGQGVDNKDLDLSAFDFTALLNHPAFNFSDTSDLSPFSAETPQIAAGPSSLSTPVDLPTNTPSHLSPSDLSQAATPTESTPSTPVSLPIPHAILPAASTSYVPPAGARFNGGRRVAATWARA